MQYTFVSGSAGRHSRLILIFSGWGMDSSPFEGLNRQGYDIAVVWDYREPEFPYQIAEGYREIALVAWSMGVLASLSVIPRLRGRLTLTLAVNGTPYPINNELGIPEQVFRGTLETLSEQSLEKFKRRMCGGAKAYSDFKSCEPRRPIQDLKDELKALESMAEAHIGCDCKWDHAVIGTADAIFPPKNQENAWRRHAWSTSHFSGPHIPCFQDLLDHFVMSKETVERRFERSATSYQDSAVVQRNIASELIALISKWGKKSISGSAKVLEVGSGTGLVSLPLASFVAEIGGSLELWDIVDCRPIPGVDFRRTDAEIEIRAIENATYDMIVSASTVQWFNSPASFIREAMRCIRPGGILAISTFIMGNLVEVAQSTGSFLPLMSESDWRNLAEEHGDVLELHSRKETLYFEDPVKVFRHLKQTGVNALSTKESLLRSLDRYPREADGACKLTYLPIFMLIRKKSPK